MGLLDAHGGHVELVKRSTKTNLSPATMFNDRISKKAKAEVNIFFISDLNKLGKLLL
ncbi:MAG: hypothetical protein HW421_4166, partial [Ignavibacteria bacterium]|nr:hypothetical protein [Ignavibacteria bacterium]